MSDSSTVQGGGGDRLVIMKGSLEKKAGVQGVRLLKGEKIYGFCVSSVLFKPWRARMAADL